MMEDLRLFFLRLAPPDIALVKFVLESYEGVAVVRTLDRKQAVIVVMAGRDFADVAERIIESLRESVNIEVLPPPPKLDEDWLLRFVSEKEE